jgi:hypothetical protein
MTAYNIQSYLTDTSGVPLVIDIQGGGDPIKDGTLLDAYKKKSSDYDNQLWRFVEAIGVAAGWYFIQSKLTDGEGNPLVIDIQGAPNFRSPIPSSMLSG